MGNARTIKNIANSVNYLFPIGYISDDYVPDEPGHLRVPEKEASMLGQRVLKRFALILCVAGPILGQNVLNGVNVKINFTSPREVQEPDNKYYQAAKDYIDWLIAHASPEGRFPGIVLMPSMEIEKYSDINMNLKAAILSCHMSYLLKDSSYYTPIEKHIKTDLRTIVGRGWPVWGEAGANGEHKEPDPRRDMFLIEPLYSDDISLAYWINGIGNKITGNFNRHASCKSTTHYFVNEGGARYNHWITAFQFTWIREYLHYFDVLLNLYENSRHPSGWPDAEPRHAVGFEAKMYYLKELVKALPYFPVDNPIVEKTREHIDKSIGGPLSMGVISEDKLGHKNNCINAYYDMYLHYVDREDTVKANQYLDLLLRNADAHMNYQPVKTTWHWTLGLTMRIYTCAYYATGEQKYLDKAMELGDKAIEFYLDIGPLPRYTAKGVTDYYKNGSGEWGDLLMLQLFELGLAVDEEHGQGHRILWTHLR